MWAESILSCADHMNTKFYTDDKHNIDDPNSVCLAGKTLVN